MNTELLMLIIEKFWLVWTVFLLISVCAIVDTLGMRKRRKEQ